MRARTEGLCVGLCVGQLHTPFQSDLIQSDLNPLRCGCPVGPFDVAISGTRTQESQDRLNMMEPLSGHAHDWSNCSRMAHVDKWEADPPRTLRKWIQVISETNGEASNPGPRTETDLLALDGSLVCWLNSVRLSAPGTSTPAFLATEGIMEKEVLASVAEYIRVERTQDT